MLKKRDKYDTYEKMTELQIKKAVQNCLKTFLSQYLTQCTYINIQQRPLKTRGHNQHK